MRILIINHLIPFPPVGGGDLRTYHLVRALASRHEVTVVGFACDEARVPPPFPVRTFEHPWEWPPLYRDMMFGDDPISEAAYGKLLNETEEPWFVSCRQSVGMEELLRRVGREGFDLVLIEHTNMARFQSALPPDVPRILDLVDLHALMAERAAQELEGAEATAAQREAQRTRRFERRAALQCALCLATSECEAKAARRLLGIDHVRVVANGVDTAQFVPGEDTQTEDYVLFTGSMDYAPNVEAMSNFAREVLPLVRHDAPAARLHIVGTRPKAEVLALAGDDVVVHGFVPDIRPYFRKAAVVVAPLLHGGGTRIKILEAAACGKAVVSTTLGAEGLDLRPGRDLVLADTAHVFAAEVVHLLNDPARRARLGRSARAAALAYDWVGIGSQLLHMVEELAESVVGCRSF
jgi:glycosyltransferase involved in cell wall biosynthesis